MGDDVNVCGSAGLLGRFLSPDYATFTSSVDLLVGRDGEQLEIVLCGKMRPHTF